VVVAIATNKPQHVHHVYHELITRTFNFNYNGSFYFLKGCIAYYLEKPNKGVSSAVTRGHSTILIKCHVIVINKP
jgi:hypothetical protein